MRGDLKAAIFCLAVFGAGIAGLYQFTAQASINEASQEAGYECYALMINEVKYSKVKGVKMNAPKLRNLQMKDGKLTVGECSILSDVVEQDKIREIKMIYKIINDAGFYRE